MKTIDRILQEKNPDIVESFLQMKSKSSESAEEVLIKSNLLDDENLLSVLSEYYELPVLHEIKSEDVDLELVRKLPIGFSRKHRLIPISQNNGTMKVVLAPPLDLYALDEVRSLFNCPIETHLTFKHTLYESINRAYEQGQEISSDIVGKETIDSVELNIQEPKDLLEAYDEAPIIKFVNSLLFQAVKEKASDIHIECFEKNMTVRFRKDGMLHNMASVGKNVQSSIISRVKIMAELDIAEKRKPQDGRIRVKVGGRDVDIRISTVPTTWGESVVMRLLDRSSVLLSLEDLGLEGEKLAKFDFLIRRPHGIILVTGPTGSGKTTSLYAALERINSPDKKIITIEDPVEYQIKGINQIQVNNKVDLTFANGLRSVLRQDPDVILVGEIRDRETADISIHASLTGHLVFSTLHTNDSASAITRLIDMNIEPFLVSSSLLAVVAQRLVRVLCKHCKVKYAPTDEDLSRIGINRYDLEDGSVFRSKGCAKCTDSGFSGRVAIFEILIIDDDIRNLTLGVTDSSTIKRKAMEKGLTTLKMDGASKVISGVTSIDEVLRVTEEEQASF